MNRIPVNRLSFAFLLFAAVFFPSAARSQEAFIPLQELPLQDLSSFQPVQEGNWIIVGGVTARLDEAAPLSTSPGTGILVNTAPAASGSHLVTTWEHGDMELELDFMMPQESNSGIYLQSRYEVQLFDSWGKQHPTASDAGGIYQRWDESRGKGREGYGGISPLQNAIRAPGLWNHLRIQFEAPRFDANGRKTKNARFRLVELNGVVVQENVEVTGPTRAAAYENEQPTGPLMIQGDHGPVAFRNIRYRRYGSDPVRLSNVRYAVYEGDFKAIDAFINTASVRTGNIGGFDWRLGGNDRFAVAFEGDLHIPASGTYLFGMNLGWIDGDPHFAGAVTGGARLTIDDRTIFNQEVADRAGGHSVTGSVSLEAGTYPFTLVYFKNRPWTHSRAEFFVEGSEIARQVLNTPASRIETGRGPGIPVAPNGEPALLRGFVWHGDGKRVNAMSVGIPGGLNYAVDLDHASILHVWRGPFVDAAPMWAGRGTDQVAIPLGSTITLSGAPSLAVLPDDAAPWPDSADAGAYKLLAYTLQKDRLPTFRYAVHGLTMEDRIEPEIRGDGQILTRSITLTGTAPANTWLQLATGDEIVDRGNGLYDIDGTYYIQVREAGGQEPVVRTQDGRQELLLPVRMPSGQSTLAYSIIW